MLWLGRTVRLMLSDLLQHGTSHLIMDPTIFNTLWSWDYGIFSGGPEEEARFCRWGSCADDEGFSEPSSLTCQGFGLSMHRAFT